MKHRGNSCTHKLLPNMVNNVTITQMNKIMMKKTSNTQNTKDGNDKLSVDFKQTSISKLKWTNGDKV